LDRRRVLAFGVLLWSAASLASAVALGLGTMLVSRALVGVGTAACVPVANALLCDVFPDAEKARTIAVFNVGLFLGGAAGFAAGDLLGFPIGIIAMAAPGLALAALIARLDVPTHREAAAPSGQGRLGRFIEHAGELLAIRTLRWVIFGAVLMAFAAGGYVAWFFDFLSQGKGMTEGAARIVFGIALVGGLAGVITGGVVSDWLRTRVAYGHLAAICIGMSATVPFALASLYLPVGAVFYVASWFTMFFITWYHGPMAAVIDDVAPEDTATTAQALVFAAMHLLGTASAPLVVGWLADAYALREALLVPTGAILVAAFALSRAFGSVESDSAAARS
jgi:predicted MFS family arabinose efflux permease